MSVLRQISTGEVRGSLENGVYAFKGIPYAEPLVGRARWLPPQPRRRWDGVRDALAYGPCCMQFDEAHPRPIVGSRRRYLEAIGELLPRHEGDDCLLLNVWTPTLDANARRPVMVYLHGGGFTHGAANELYDATAFAAKGVVAVVIQYRLGVLGFLHGQGLFNGELCADNRAFLDQLESLRWVQENIARFGGDPSNVTVFGESAGACGIYQLVASPMAKGLFKRAIAMGGMPFMHAPAAEYHRLTRDVLADVGIAPTDGDALAALDRAGLQRLQTALRKRVFRSGASQPYGSVSQIKWNWLGAATGTDFLPSPPLPVYATGTPNDVELLLGTCGDDGQLFSMMLPIPALSAWLFMGQLKGLIPKGDVKALVTHYRRLLPRQPRRRIWEAINNDALFRMPTLAAAEAHARGHAGRTYLYQLDCRSSIDGLRAIHGIDVALLLGRRSILRNLLPTDPETSQLSEQMLTAWVRFAETGQPSAPGLATWTPFDPETRSTLVLDRVSRIETGVSGTVYLFHARDK